MLTTGQKQTLRRVASRCVELGDYSALYSWVSAFDSRPRPVSHSIDVNIHDEGALVSMREQFEQKFVLAPTWIDRLRAWWYGPR